MHPQVALPWQFHLVILVDAMAGVPDDLLMLRELRVLANRDWIRLISHPAGPDLSTEAGRKFHIVRVGLSRGTGARGNGTHVHPVRTARSRLQYIESPIATLSLIHGHKRRGNEQTYRK